MIGPVRGTGFYHRRSVNMWANSLICKPRVPIQSPTDFSTVLYGHKIYIHRSLWDQGFRLFTYMYDAGMNEAIFPSPRNGLKGESFLDYIFFKLPRYTITHRCFKD